MLVISWFFFVNSLHFFRTYLSGSIFSNCFYVFFSYRCYFQYFASPLNPSLWCVQTIFSTCFIPYTVHYCSIIVFYKNFIFTILSFSSVLFQGCSWPRYISYYWSGLINNLIKICIRFDAVKDSSRSCCSIRYLNIGSSITYQYP